jgi:PAS domain S-box-containing protein
VERGSSTAPTVLQSLASAGAHPILQSFPHGAIIVFDADLRYLSAGGQGLADVGLCRQALEGQTIFDVFPPEVTTVIEPLYRAALRGSETTLDVPYQGRTFLQRLGPVRDADGTIVAGMGFTQDVTESRLTEQRLQESEARLKVLIEHAPIGLATISLDGRYLEVNPAFCAITGYRAEHLLQSRVAEAANPIYSEEDETGMRRLVAGEISSYTTDTRIHASDGTIRWVNGSASMLRNADGSPSEYIVQIKDITERKRMERALQEETTRLRNAEAVGRSGSWELDATDGTLQWSAGLFDIYGVDPDTFDGDFIATLHLVHPDDLAATEAAIAACVRFGTPYQIRYRMA